ncbi:MAG: helix-turn-helix transcriptional regulator [Firmicutes bacterium]|jgi:transcriptional regulator with XRE-family HTH domain|nr:helix-turn-helix transcriptional regulator [Bacillota bacterium]
MIILHKMRKKRRLTQQQLATISGVSQQAISSIENGSRQSPSVETLYKLSRALKCTVDDLIEENGEEGA